MDIQNVKYTDGGYILNNQFFIPNDEDNMDYQNIQLWVKKGNVVEAKDKKSIDQIMEEKQSTLRLEASRRILEPYPQYKQINHMKAVIEIQNKELIALKSNSTYILTSEEEDMMAAAGICNDAVDIIRKKSNEIEASLDSMSLTELEAFDPTNDCNWI